jgi:hypothetical protein
MLQQAAKNSDPYRECLYSVDINNKKSDSTTLMSSAKRVKRNGMETAGFISFSIIAVCGFRISFLIES